MQSRLFRKVALERLSSPEKLDAAMQVIQPRAWIAALTVAVLFGVMFIWALVAEIPVTLHTQGILEVAENSELRAVLYLRAEQVQTIKSGMDVELAPLGVSPQEFGYLEGVVASIGSHPTADPIARQMIPDAAAYPVYITLIADDNSPTGYAWSIAEGPNIALPVGLTLTGEIVLRIERPIQHIFPILD